LIVAVPVVEAVNVLVHVAVPAVVPATNVQVVNVPVTPLTVKVTEPVGVVAPVGEVSVTVAVHVEPWFTNTGVVHVTLVLVGWPPTLTLNGEVELLPL
jgi:hypothetical protein